MATKWKRFTRNGLTKIIAFVLAVALSGMTVWSVGMIALRLSANEFSPDILFDKDQWIWQSMYDEHVRAGLLYDDLRSNRTEERIRTGETVNEREIVDAMYQAYLDGEEFTDDSSLDKEDRLTDKKSRNSTARSAVRCILTMASTMRMRFSHSHSGLRTIGWRIRSRKGF